MRNVLFLVSGNGGTFKFINEAIVRNELNLKVVAVIADRDCGAFDYALKNNIVAYKILLKKDKQEELKKLIESISPDFVVTNIHRILHKDVISLENIKFINLHYSLLPSYSGLIGMDTITKAKKDNNKFIGATVHLVEEEVDKGEILNQCVISVNWKNKSANLYFDDIFRGGCFILLNQLLSLSKNSSNNFKVDDYNSMLFNPALLFNPNKFDSTFWKKLK